MENNFGIPAPLEDEYQVRAWGMPEKNGKFVPMVINRPQLGEKDVKMEVTFCGICHSDVTMGEDPIGSMAWPFIPGHEFIGKVVEVGSAVEKTKVGDNVGVGCFVDKCDTCENCQDGEESYCAQKVISINAKKLVNGKGNRLRGNLETRTEGGYSEIHVVHEDFAFVIPANLDPAQAAPILCGGITMYDPLKHWGALDRKNMTIGIIGVGGLGTFGIKLAKAMGHTVMAISTSVKKEEMSKNKGADLFCVSTDPESVKANSNKCDLILNTVSASHDLNVYLPLLRRDGVIVQLGICLKPHPIMQIMLMRGRKSVSGSSVGNLKNHQEVIDFCAQHNITSDIEVVQADKIDWVYEQLKTANKDGIRYVIDVKKSLENEDFTAKI
jgi:uncharacterized zinc-type alcohol dehydrogenase-like protein